MNKALLTLLITLLMASCSGGGGGDVGIGAPGTGMVWDQDNFDEKNWQ